VSERLLVGLALCVPIALNRLWRRPLFRPAGLMAAVWAALLLGQEIFVPDFVFSEEAAWTILLVVSCFIAGDFWAAYMVRRYDLTAPSVRPTSEPTMKAATLVCGALALAGAVWQFAAYASHVGGIGELFTAGGAVRTLWAEREISIPIYGRVMATFGHAGVVLALTAWSKIGRRWWMALPLVAVIVFSVSIMGRIGILMLAVDVFLITYYRDVAKDARTADRRLFLRFLPALFVVAAIFAGGEVLRASSDLEANVVSRTFASYAFSGPSGLTEWLKSSRIGVEPAWGAQSFDSVAAMIGAKQQLVGVYDDFAQLSVRYDDMGNIYTAVRPLVEDFGLLGACVFMAVFGVAAGFVFERTRAGSLPARALSCALGLYIVFTVITPMTVFSSWILSATIPPLVLACPPALRGSKLRTHPPT